MCGTHYDVRLMPKATNACSKYPKMIELRCIVIDDNFDPKTFHGEALAFRDRALNFACTQTRTWNVTLASPNLTDTHAQPSEVSQLQYMFTNGTFKPGVPFSSCPPDETDMDDPCYIASHDVSETLPMQIGEFEFQAQVAHDRVVITDILNHSHCYELPICLSRHGSTATTCTVPTTGLEVSSGHRMAVVHAMVALVFGLVSLSSLSCRLETGSWGGQGGVTMAPKR
eukprot:UN3557